VYKESKNLVKKLFNLSIDVYKELDNLRSADFEKYFNTFTNLAEENKEKHEKSLKFLEDIYNGNKKDILSFILESNRGPSDLEPSLTVILMDATGSMGRVID